MCYKTETLLNFLLISFADGGADSSALAAKFDLAAVDKENQSHSENKRIDSGFASSLAPGPDQVKLDHVNEGTCPFISLNKVIFVGQHFFSFLSDDVPLHAHGETFALDSMLDVPLAQLGHLLLVVPVEGSAHGHG